MVVVLCGVALAMVAGGAWAIVQGYDDVLMQRNVALMISGAVGATGGLLLFGIGAALSRLRRIEGTLQRTLDRLARSGDLGLPVLPPRAPVPEVVPAAVGAGAVPAAAAEPPPDHPAPDAAARAERADDAGLPSDRPAEPAGEAVAPSGPTAAPAPSVPAEEPDVMQAPLRGSLEGVEPDAPHDRGSQDEERRRDQPDGAEVPPAGPLEVPRTDESSSDAAASEAAIVGSYTSGGNAYVMYSDGSIEAETPTGRYRFGSLDELKAFIASGGEAPSGAASDRTP